MLREQVLEDGSIHIGITRAAQEITRRVAERAGSRLHERSRIEVFGELKAPEGRAGLTPGTASA